jgi:hypothetical protein
MSDSDRRLGMLFGLLGAALLVVEGILRAVGGFVSLTFGHGGRAVGAWEGSVLFFVVGLLVGFFALIGRSGSGDRGLASGVLLIVLAILGWALLGFGTGLFALLGGLLALIGGILFLVGSR